MSPVFKILLVMAESETNIKNKLDNTHYIDFITEVENVNKVDLIIK
jgi:hypothetical protein